LEGTRDRESHLAERVAASVTGGYRSPHAFLRSFKIVAVEERDITSTASRSSVAPFNLRAFEISAVGKGPSGRSGAFLTPSPPAEKATARQDQAEQPGTDDGTGDAQSLIKELDLGGVKSTTVNRPPRVSANEAAGRSETETQSLPPNRLLNL